MSNTNPSKGKSKYPLDQGTLNPIFNTPNLALDTQKDTENDDAQSLQGKAVILLDPTANPVKAIGSTNPLAMILSDATNQVAIRKLFSIGSYAGGVYPALFTNSVQMLANTVLEQFEYARTPTVYKNITTLANGSTAIWTSGVGKKWRLMGICITMLQGTTAAGACALKMLDVAADMGIGTTICIAAMTAVLNGFIILQGTFGNGILAAATNTALNVNLSSVLAVGGVSVQVWGTEE